MRGGDDLEQERREAYDLLLRHGPEPVDASPQGLALEQLHHEEGRTVFGGPVVEHRHDARMRDAVGGAPLLTKAVDQLRIDRELGSKDLERDAPPVSVAALVHARHAADPDQALDGPLFVDHAAEPRIFAEPAHRVVDEARREVRLVEAGAGRSAGVAREVGEERAARQALRGVRVDIGHQTGTQLASQQGGERVVVRAVHAQGVAQVGESACPWRPRTGPPRRGRTYSFVCAQRKPRSERDVPEARLTKLLAGSSSTPLDQPPPSADRSLPWRGSAA